MFFPVFARCWRCKQSVSVIPGPPSIQTTKCVVLEMSPLGTCTRRASRQKDNDVSNNLPQSQFIMTHLLHPKTLSPKPSAHPEAGVVLTYPQPHS